MGQPIARVLHRKPVLSMLEVATSGSSLEPLEALGVRRHPSPSQQPPAAEGGMYCSLTSVCMYITTSYTLSAVLGCSALANCSRSSYA